MSYKLYLDKAENFECEVAVKNASLKGSIARLIVESDGVNLVFNGKIDGDKCVIPIKKLKGILDENTKGNMHLELIVEDIYFKPWQSDYTVEEHTSVKVKVDETTPTSNKPSVKVKLNDPHPLAKYVDGKPTDKVLTAKRKGINVFVPMKEISMICEQFGIKKKNFKQRKNDFLDILKEYFKANPEYNYHKRSILGGIDSFLK